VRNRIKTIAVAAVVSALTVAGLAVAENDGGGEDGKQGKARWGERPPGPPPGAGVMLGPGPGGGKLTYSETHLRRDGKDVTVRVDKGKVTAVDGDSIEIERNDGETVEVAVDDDTRVFAGPRKRNAEIEDVATGKQAIVVREGDSEAAETVAVVPKRAHFIKRLRGRHPGGPGFRPEGMPVPPPPSGDRG
jgi:hypothetical protein